MRKIILILIFSLLLGCISSENNSNKTSGVTETPAQETPVTQEKENSIAWVYNIEEAKGIAQEENKLILIDFNAEWCVWCKRMEESTYKDEGIINIVNKNFVPVYFNLDIQANKVIYMEDYDKYVHGALPTILILNSKGKPLYRIVGYKTVGQFKGALTQILEKENG